MSRFRSVQDAPPSRGARSPRSTSPAALPRVPARGSASHGDVDMLLQLIYRHAGLCFPQHKLPLIERRATRALRDNGQASFGLGVAHLAQHPNGPVMQAVINALTINETYFYRELDQMRLLCSDLIPQIDRSAGPIRVLSLPCSTGEEPYSVALYCKENLPPDVAARVQVSGADIDSAAVEQARLGRYRERSVSRLPGLMTQRYFRKDRDGDYVLDPMVRRKVTLATANLLDPAVMRQFRMIDVVFCRNVLIYFDDVAKTKALSHLHQIIRPGGCLLLAHAEQIGRLDVPFTPKRLQGARVHIRT